jgi:FtsP/CotA-like multicopper oxidase with cupredoxin domain
VRLLNEGQLLHPMHLHGFHFTVIGRDGHKVPVPYDVDTLVIAPGERYDVVFKANLPGTWAFHCHILSHAESEHGMHGMVTAVIVQ